MVIAGNINRQRTPAYARSLAMGNGMATTAAVLHEEAEPVLKIDSGGYEIRSIVTDSSRHPKDNLGRPVLVFDSWKIAQSDLKDRHPPTEGFHIIPTHSDATPSNHDHNCQTNTSSAEELSTFSSTKAFNEERQRANKENEPHSKNSFVRKPRPNSLAILSRSHDLIHTIGDKEVTPITTSIDFSNSSSVPLHSYGRTASADNILKQTRSTIGLQQRRNQRPTSLQIPNIIQLAPESSHTARPHVTATHHLPFTR